MTLALANYAEITVLNQHLTRARPRVARSAREIALVFLEEGLRAGAMTIADVGRENLHRRVLAHYDLDALIDTYRHSYLEFAGEAQRWPASASNSAS